ncbi:TIGR03790 family protein [Nitrosovibrio sp. Nv4]|uniref:TIGR03790 family protein n=1 Tax=Nitrosovibrio sp. Nv4 TaxID=1945880 RepID=UPI000BD35E01|nr:TIGR03790 family protein [Nitrosovibrio sp. Nv4]SOD39910.1 TIGR03790 family protein [Nitrosovibrio sp. Nv4]
MTVVNDQTAPCGVGCKSPFSAIKLLVSSAIALLVILVFVPLRADAQARIQLPRTGLKSDDIAVIVNDNDPLSRQIGRYYQKVRHIPAGNMIHLQFPSSRNTLPRDEFKQLKAEIDRKTPAHVQAYAVAWTLPYRVDCMSLTSALAFGFDENYCSASCGPTQSSRYFNSPSLDPVSDHNLRPAMMLAGTDFEQVKALIDRGVAADHSFPDGRAYLMITPDTARNVRANYFELTAKELAGVFPIEILETEAISDRDDVLFYFTGLSRVPQLDTLDFLPGALADHLTSAGGQLTDSSQMSSLRWLEAGATASYGTVVEPCNHMQKFPFPAIAMFHYALGASAIEAYWKSVAWPGEGVFVGEPLAQPFAPDLRRIRDGQFELHVFSPRDGPLRFEQSRSAAGPYKPLAQQSRLRRGPNTVRFKFAETQGYLRLRW